MVDVKALRKQLELTQAEFARALDVAEYTVRRWEKGAKMHKGNQHRLEKIAEKAEQLIK